MTPGKPCLHRPNALWVASSRLLCRDVDLLLDLAHPWGYVLVFLLALAEGAALVGLLLPGETAMLLGGVLVYQDRATLPLMLLIGCLGSVIGDSVGYWVGRRFGGRIRSSRLGRKVGEAKWEKAGNYLRERGAKAVFFARFLGFLRTLVPPLAGSTGMPYRRFVIFNAPAAALWATSFILLGVAAGRSWEAVDRWAGRASAVLLLVVGIALAIVLAARWLQRREAMLRQRWHAFLDDETVQHLRKRFRPQIEYVQRRLDPRGRFGLYLTIGLAVALLAAAGFGAVVDSLAERGDVAQVDAALLAFFSDHQMPRVDPAMELVAGAANVAWTTGAIFLVGTASYRASRRRRWIVFAVLVLAGALLLDDAARSLLDVFGIRPGHIRAAAASVFPSSEATAGGAFVGQLAYATGRTMSWRVSVWATAAALFVGILAALALLYLARQTPSAMLAGFLLGVFWAGVSVISSNQLSHLWSSSGRGLRGPTRSSR